MDPVEQLLWDALAAEAVNRADLARIVATSADVDTAVDRARRVFPEWRLGQTYCNVLRVVRPDLYLEVVGTEVDTFYRDDRLDLLRAWLARRLP